jgi:multidrug efflux pump subunit AcrB
MLSTIFVDRPRLAIVIAIATTIAGALALFTIPIAQYPDIVPPQVSVTTFYPGANSGVVDATVAQPIEAQVVGRCRACRPKFSAKALLSKRSHRRCLA